jgi:uncharacterized protein
MIAVDTISSSTPTVQSPGGTNRRSPRCGGSPKVRRRGPFRGVHEFLAITTHPRIFRTPTPLGAALDQIEAWFESPSLVMLNEHDHYWPTLRTLIRHARLDGPRVHDARVAALCLSHAVTELWTADRDFSLFPALRIRNPLVG